MGRLSSAPVDPVSRSALDVPGVLFQARAKAATRLSGSSRRIPSATSTTSGFPRIERWITFLAHDLLSASTSTVYVIPTSGGAWRAITDGAWFDDKPRWGPDGRVLYFVSNRSGVRQRLGTTIRQLGWRADRRAIPCHVVSIRAVPVDAPDRADGHRRDGHASAAADERIAQRDLDAGPRRPLNRVCYSARACPSPSTWAVPDSPASSDKALPPSTTSAPARPSDSDRRTP